MLSGIPASRIWRSRRSSSGSNDTAPRTTSDKDKEQTHRSRDFVDAHEESELASLNGALECLTNIFQDVQVEVLREMLSTFSAESRLQLVTECLLKNKDKWVKGRWRVPEPYVPAAADQRRKESYCGGALLRGERFRSSSYKTAVKDVLYREFKNISHSSIKAILAENNFSYLDSRLALVDLMSKSWRISVTNLIFRRKLPSVEQCPLIRWQENVSGAKEPVVIPTRCQELNEELERTLVADFRSKARNEQLQKDVEYAEQINDEEAELAGATFECECCFIPHAFERVVTCDALDHFVCFRCISNSMSEALFGQGWNSSIDKSKCSLKCIALQAGESGACEGSFSPNLVEKALLTQPQGHDLWASFERRLAEETVAQISEPISRCPFCAYAEIQTAANPFHLRRVPAYVKAILLILSIGLLVVRLHPILGTILAFSGCFYLARLNKQYFNELCFESKATKPVPDENFGTKFICRNTTCSRVSCLRCKAPWVDVHVCHQSSRQALRTFIESAVTDAIKRTCPKCNLSFVKSSGCNKLVCVCGYSMCYLCRQDVGKEGYTHFCPHFRTNPGQACEECNRCDLYRTEDEEKVIAEAKQRAILAWKEQRKEDKKGDDEAVDEIVNGSTRNERETKKRIFRLF